MDRCIVAAGCDTAEISRTTDAAKQCPAAKLQRRPFQHAGTPQRLCLIEACSERFINVSRRQVADTGRHQPITQIALRVARRCSNPAHRGMTREVDGVSHERRRRIRQ
jgi:hypothetical protein